MPLSAEDADRLAKLKAARDRYLLGETETSISASGRSVAFAPLPKDELEAEIARLEAAATSNAETPPPRRGAIQFGWSR